MTTPKNSGEVILGIDPGSLKTGFGALRLLPNGNIEHISHGLLLLSPKKTLPDRLADLAQDLKELLAGLRPNHAVIEDVFFHKNPQSALVLGQARGALLAMLGLHGIRPTAMSATQVKSLIAGRGHAKKFQVAQIVALELNINVPEREDASDALALALAHAFTLRKAK